MSALHFPNATEQIDSLNDYHALARTQLDDRIWHYLHDGADRDLTAHWNRTAFDALTIQPRPLRNVAGGHTRLTLFGQAVAHPILLAPIAYQKLFHTQGECASALAASAQEGLMTVSSLASQPLEEIADAGNNSLWFQLYWQGERQRTLRLLRRAEAAGYQAIVLTVDAPVKQATLVLPAHVSSVNLEAVPPRPALKPGQSSIFDGWMTLAPDWDDLAWLRSQTDLPLLLKGIMHADDAERAVALRCDGLIVSNHGGRVLDSAPASLHALSAVLNRIEGRIPVLFDSGIRSGRDIFKALALGADAVLLGRPYIWGLTVAGAMGVAHVIRLLRDELEMTMALSGCATLPDINRKHLQTAEMQHPLLPPPHY
jgi:4-hydroxymandelate oxidase